MMLKKSFAAILAVVLAFSCLLIIPAAADEDVIWDKTAQQYTGSHVGMIIESDQSIFCLEGAGHQTALFDDESVIMTKGDYVGVVFVALYEKPAIPVTFGMLDYTYIVPGTDGKDDTYVIRNVGNGLNSGAFGDDELKQYKALTFDFRISEPEVEVGFRLQFYNNATMRVQRVMVLKKGAEIPEPPVLDDSAPTPPEGTVFHDHVDVPLTEDNVVFTNDTSGQIVDGRVEFRKMSHTGGGIKNLQNGIYLTPGTKMAQFYVRIPEENSGTYAFLELLVTQNGLPIVNQRITCDDFAGYANQTKVFTYTFQVTDASKYDIKLSWKGNYDTILDKVVFSDTSDIEMRDVKKNAVATEDGYTISFTKDILAEDEMTSLDTYLVKVGDLTQDLYIDFFLPVNFINEWLNAGYDAIRVDITEPQQAVADALRAEISTYDAEITELGLFDLSFTLLNGSNETVLQNLPNSIRLRAMLKDQQILGFSDGRKLSLSYLSSGGSNTSSIKMINSALENNQRFVELSVKELGTMITCVADTGK